MKELEKWLEIVKKEVNPQDGITWLNWSTGARRAWKEALKWVLTHPDSTTVQYERYHLDFIREELSDET